MTSWAIAIVAFGILVVVASSFLLVRNFSRLEEDHSREDLRRIRNAVASEISNLDSVARDYASSDQTYRFALHPTTAYVNSELTDSNLRTIRVNALLILNSTGKVVIIKTLEDDDHRSLPVDDLLRMQRLAKRLVGPISTETGVTGVTRTSQGAYLFAARPILDSQYRGPSHGTLIMARQFNDLSARRLSALVNLPITVADVDVDVRGHNFVNDNAIERVGSTMLAGTVILRGPESEPALVLHTEIPVVIESQARRAQWYLVAILLTIATVLGVVKLAWLERKVLQPIADLSSTIKQVTEHDDLSKRTPLRSGARNELAMLIVRVNLMLDRLQRSRDELLQARSSLEHQGDARRPHRRPEPIRHPLAIRSGIRARSPRFASRRCPDDRYRSLQVSQR